MLGALADAGLDHVQISIQDSEPTSADHIAGYDGAFARKRALAAEVVRHKLPLTVNAVMHRANIERIERHGRACARARRQPGRDRACAVLRLGVEEPRHADADAGTGRARRARRSRTCASVITASIVIDAVVPDYYARYPEAVRRRLGPALAQRDAGRQGAALSRGGVDSAASNSGTCASIRSPTSGRIRRRSTPSAAPPGCRSRARAARGATAISAAAAARPLRSPAMRARPTRSATSSPRPCTTSTALAAIRSDAPYVYRRM